MAKIYANLNTIGNNTVADNPSPYLYQRDPVYDRSSRKTDILKSSLNEIYINLSNIWDITVEKNSSPYSNHRDLVAVDSSRTSDILRSPTLFVRICSRMIMPPPTSGMENTVDIVLIALKIFTMYTHLSITNEHIPRIIPKYQSTDNPTFVSNGPIHPMQTADLNRHTMEEIFNAPATLSTNQNLNFHPPNTHP
ncbi:hypothetical protein RF11_05906 [Thelohanellus kitauei]|uniref:Uncharacterized protein n=1 Tax=Thelohanellus kitauei TaxID=669202 RepID=A0A0C2JK79_THEKT|nr:hypothetical protein RF11_05906 [Thelohanellus kitauei]